VAGGATFTDVRKIGKTLEGIEDATAYGAPCLKLNGRIFACEAINKQAEPNSLMVRLPLDQRDALIEEAPDVYYLKPHYEPWPCVLVRLHKVHRDALRDLLTGAWRHASAEKPARSRRKAPRRGAPSEAPAARPKSRRSVS
jgi:hypothetical protein